ncbi:MAG: hypothetical protein ACKVQC_07085 [Elusimicrobiota bacterium]
MKYKFLFLAVVISLIHGTIWAGDYAKRLEGKRLIIKGARHAGIEFKNKDVVVGYAEITRDESVYEARIRWVESDLFLVTEKNRSLEKCPPRNWLYKVLRISGNLVTLKEYGTGWSNLKDEISEYQLVP